MIRVEETLIGSEQIPLVLQVIDGRDAPLAAIVDWLHENKQTILQARDRYGAVLLRGFTAIDSAPAFAAVLDVVAPQLMDYVGGSAPRKSVYGRVTTASGLPENFSLALHQEMAYQNSRPDALALFCETPPVEGGETPIADARVVTKRLDRELRARFDALGVRVRRALPQTQCENTLPRPWPDVFGTSDQTEVERIAEAKGWNIEWRHDNSMFLSQQLLPAFRTHPRTGERVWANQVHYHTPECMLRWALRDGRHQDAADIRKLMNEAPEKLDYVFHNDGSRVSAEDAEHVWDVLVQSEIPLQWRRSDILLLDNVLAMHGRRAFRGPRQILVGLILDQPALDQSLSAKGAFEPGRRPRATAR